MADVDHELGAIRFIVNSPLSSKVAMFNNVATQHRDSQLLNPFSADGDMTKRTFSKDDYGKPLAGSLTEMRGAKANIHVCKEMLQLCQIIVDEGWPYSPENPDLKVMRFGDLFNIYTLISDKVVGILLRARKYKLIDFDGEVLFQRRDDDVLVFMLKSLEEIKTFLEEKQEEVRRSVSPAPTRHLSSDDGSRRSVSPAPRDNLIQANMSRENSPSPVAVKLEQENSPALTESFQNNSISTLKSIMDNNNSEANTGPRINLAHQNSISSAMDLEKSASKSNVNNENSLLLEKGVAKVSISSNTIDLASKSSNLAAEVNSENVKEEKNTALITSKNENNIILKIEEEFRGNFTSGENSTNISALASS